MSDVIRKLATEMYQSAEKSASSSHPGTVKMTISSEIAKKALNEAGFEDNQIKDFGKALGLTARAVHVAATMNNIETIKECVSKGADYRNQRTVATARINSAIHIQGTSRAQKDGEVTRPDGAKLPYQKFNHGDGTVIVGTGLPSDIMSEFSEQTKSIVKKSSYYVPLDSKTK